LTPLVLDSAGSPITTRVYNMALDEFFAWYAQEPRAGFTKATVSARRVFLEARGLGSLSSIVRMSTLRKRAVEATDNGNASGVLACRRQKGSAPLNQPWCRSETPICICRTTSFLLK
jgi:hypothetical protein